MASVYVRYEVPTIQPGRYRYFNHREDAEAFARQLADADWIPESEWPIYAFPRGPLVALVANSKL